MSTVVARPLAMAPAASMMAGIPIPDIDRHTGPRRAWYTNSLPKAPTMPSTSRIATPASASAPSAASKVIERESCPSSTRACCVLYTPEITTSWNG
jgi:hypothetical protein